MTGLKAPTNKPKLSKSKNDDEKNNNNITNNNDHHAAVHGPSRQLARPLPGINHFCSPSATQMRPEIVD